MSFKQNWAGACQPSLLVGFKLSYSPSPVTSLYSFKAGPPDHSPATHLFPLPSVAHDGKQREQEAVGPQHITHRLILSPSFLSPKQRVHLLSQNQAFSCLQGSCVFVCNSRTFLLSIQFCSVLPSTGNTKFVCPWDTRCWPCRTQEDFAEGAAASASFLIKRSAQ